MINKAFFVLHKKHILRKSVFSFGINFILKPFIKNIHQCICCPQNLKAVFHKTSPYNYLHVFTS